MIAQVLAFAVATMTSLQSMPRSAIADVMPERVALSDRYPDELFMVIEPFLSRGTVDLSRSGGLIPVSRSGCLPDEALSRRGEYWFVFNNRGSEGGKYDLLALIVMKVSKKNESGGPPASVAFGALRNFERGYRGQLYSFFRPTVRQPLRGMTVERWNEAHRSNNFRMYDALFGRSRNDQFHAAPTPGGVSSSHDSEWWAVQGIDLNSAKEVVIDHMLLRFQRAAYDQPAASGIRFSVTGGAYNELVIRSRFNDGARPDPPYHLKAGQCHA